MSDHISVETAEALNRNWTDAFVREEGWKQHGMTDPIGYIELFLQEVSGTAILDAGCGWGRYIPRFLNRGVTYTGIDLSPECIRVAREAHPGTTFDVGNVRTLPYADAAFNGVWSCCSLSGIPKKHVHEALKEYIRVLVPDGVVLIIMPIPPHGRSEEGFIYEKGTPILFQAYYELEEFREHIATVGLETVEADYDFQRGSFFILARKRT